MAHSSATAPATQPAADASETRGTYEFLKSKQLTGDWGGFRKDLEQNGFKMELSYQQQWQQNFRGGLNTHNAERFTGTYDWVFQLDFNRMGLIAPQTDFESGFYLKAKGTYNESVQEYVGSLFNPNTDPAGRDVAIWIDKWWLWQKFFKGKLEIRLGVLETVKDLFDISLYANHEDRDFLNRASYRNVLIPHMTGMGAFAKLQLTDWWYFQGAAIDAQAQRFHTQFDTAFHKEDWYLGFWETGFTPQWKTAKGPMPGRYRVGFWYDPRVRSVFVEEGEEPDMRGHDVGMYVGLDQMVWKENSGPDDDQGLGLFGRYGGAHGDINRVSCYWQIGASYKGLIPTRDRDVFGFAWSNGILSDQYRNFEDERADEEGVYEWYYSWQVTPWLTVSPDFQVITNPGGTTAGRDAIVGGIRVRVIF